MSDFFDGLKVIVLAAIAIVVLGAVSFEAYATLAPRTTAIQNTVFHNSQQYSDAQTNNLAAYAAQYAECVNPACRAAIRSIVQEQYASYPDYKLTPDLSSFLDKMRGTP
jgi:hypothetical protein